MFCPPLMSEEVELKYPPSICACCELDNLINKQLCNFLFEVWLHLGVRKVPFENWICRSCSKMAAAINVHLCCEHNLKK